MTCSGDPLNVHGNFVGNSSECLARSTLLLAPDKEQRAMASRHGRDRGLPLPQNCRVKGRGRKKFDATAASKKLVPF